MGVSVTDRDNGYQALRSVFDQNGTKLDVGVFGNKNETYDNGVTTTDVGTWAEYGTKHAPARPWLSGWLDENWELVIFRLRMEMSRVVRGQQTKTQALTRVGQRIRDGIRDRILAKIPPPNAESTIRKKGFDHPLLETGRFLEAITYRVVLGH